MRFAAALSRSWIVAVGVNSDGRREVLGMDIGPPEAETFWTAFQRKLVRRGLRSVKLVGRPGHQGSRGQGPNATWRGEPATVSIQ